MDHHEAPEGNILQVEQAAATAEINVFAKAQQMESSQAALREAPYRAGKSG